MINQNVLCDCGSGRQYKRCCGNKVKRKSSNPLAKFNTIDILQTLAALTLVEENHGKNLRLEACAVRGVQQLNNSTKNIHGEQLRGFLQEEFASDPNEDPTANLFTEVVAFQGGDHLVLPGISQNPAFILNQLLRGVFQWPQAQVNEQFKFNCQQYTRAILVISDSMARKAGLTRYLRGELKGKHISFPAPAQLTRYKKAVYFSDQEMQDLFTAANLDLQALKPFLANLSHPGFKQYHTGYSPLLLQPILKVPNGYVVVSPATLTHALIELLKQVADGLSCGNALHEAYHVMNWDKVKMYLQFMNFKNLIIPEVPFPVQPGVQTVFAQFDDDKIAVVQYLAMSPSGSAVNLQTFDQQRAQLIADIAALPRYQGFKFLSLCIPAVMNEDLMMPITMLPQMETLMINMFDFDVIGQTRRTKALDLWNFALGRKAQVPKPMQVSILSFLDEYAIYQAHEDSFYLSDEGFDVSSWRYGSGQSLMATARKANDEHSMKIRKTDGGIARTYVTRKDQYAPIYVAKGDLVSRQIRYAVEGFTPAVWVEANKAVEDPGPATTNLYFEFTEAICYWLWQMTADIDPYLKSIDPDCFGVRFEFADVSAAEQFNVTDARDPNIFNNFQINAEGDTIQIVIPTELLSYFYGADNEGDRILVKALLTGISLLRTKKGLLAIPDGEVSRIIDKNAPLGIKKKLISHHSGINWILDNNGLPKPRYVQDYHSSAVANSIVRLLGSNCPPVGEVTDPQLKKRLPIEIVKALLGHLKHLISRYGNENLLKRLMALNESLIRDREMLRIKTPTRIACFVGQEQHTIDLAEMVSNSSRATAAVRCLIEHLAAEPATGSQMMSTAGLDELMAIMDAVIAWGSVGDQLTYELFDIRVGVLPTGRIGTQKTVVREIFDPYHHEKTKEMVQDTMAAFSEEFPSAQGMQANAAIPASLDNAFQAEFKITLTRLFEFMRLVVELGLMQGTGYAQLDLQSLKAEAGKSKKTFSEDECNHAIEFLGLRNRGTVETRPTGYAHYDISPWRMSRRLSLMRKPLVIIDGQDAANPTIYWGPRQVLKSAGNILEQGRMDRLRVPEKGPVKKALATFVHERGASLVKAVLQQLSIKGAIIDDEVTIAPKGKLKHQEDIGDIDVLLIDPVEKVLYSLECKGFAPSRTIHEMIEECAKLLGSDSEKGLIEKHEIRHEWIQNNLAQIGQIYNCDLTGYTVRSAFITKESMIFPFVMKTNTSMPFMTLYHLESDGYAALQKLF